MPLDLSGFSSQPKELFAPQKSILWVFPFFFQADQLVKVVITHSMAPVFSASSLNIQGKGAPGDTSC